LTWKNSINSFDIEYTDNCNNSFNLSGKINQVDPMERTDEKFISTDFKVQLMQGDQVIYETNTDSNGDYTFNGIDGGIYLLLISQPYKTKYGRKIEVLENTTRDFKDIKLYLGDFNEDGIINNKDKYILYEPKCMNKTVADNPECYIYDLNGDTRVTVSDSNIMTSTKNYERVTDIFYSGNSELKGKVIDISIEPTIELVNNDNTYNANVLENGNFVFNDIPNGGYNLKIKRDGYLGYSKYILLSKDINNINVTLIPGDINNDSIIDKNDLVDIKNAVESGVVPDTDIKKKYDLNNDGVCDQKDIDLVKNNIGKTY